MLYGARLSLLMGIGATVVCLVIGVPLGLAAGYYRGRVDEAIMRLDRPADLGAADPDGHPDPVDDAAQSVEDGVRGRHHLRADHGAPDAQRDAGDRVGGIRARRRARAASARWYILGAEILPNAWPPIIVESALRVTFAIMLGAALSFLGLGVHPPASDWGLMIAEARPFIVEAPWVAIAPGIVLCITVIAVNLIGDGLREVLDPRLRRGRG